MAWPASLNVGLKEWAIVCDALCHGRQIVLLRKGGIHEVEGKFEIENNEFLLFPTYLHQNPAMVKDADRVAMRQYAAEPETIEISSAVVITDIVKVASRPRIDAIDAEHIWMPPLIDMRFNYKPHNPLYLLLVRAHRLPQPLTVANTPEYAGCRSWVSLTENIPTGGAIPVLDDVRYEMVRQRILARIA